MIYFTADQHYGSERALTLSKRPFLRTELLSDAEIELEIERKSFRTTRQVPDVTAMNAELIRLHNETVTRDDIVFHLGDFGKFDALKHLNGCMHILIMGNYEMDDMKKNWNNDFEEYSKYVKSFGFKDVCSNKEFTLYKRDYDNIENSKRYDVFLTHKPDECIKDGSYMNLFGHTHGLQKIKKYGIDVGVDCNRFRPISSDDCIFYIDAIKNGVYDSNVFE